MQTKKMSLANIKGKLSRAEMKNIMAGSGGCSQNMDFCGTSGGIVYTCCPGDHTTCINNLCQK